MNIIHRISVFLILGLIQSGSIASEIATDGSAIDWTLPKSIKDHMVYKLTPVKGEQTFAPNVVPSDPSLAENFSEIYLVRSENIEEGETFTLFINASYMDNNWRNYNKAVISDDIELAVSTLKKIKPGCKHKNPYQEQLAINIDFIEIIDAMSTGMDLRLSNENAHTSINSQDKRTETIKIPGNYFLAIMQTIKSE